MDVVGKITSNSRDPENNKHSEILGYTHSNLFAAGGASVVAVIKAFSQGVNSLTQNTYETTVVTYDIELDTYSE